MNLLINRDDRVGLIINMVLAVSFAASANSIIFLAGWDRTGTQAAPSFAPPGYVVGIIWLLLFALMGAARWLVIRSESAVSGYHARLVVILIVFCFLYPFYTVGFNLIAGLLGNIATILVASWVGFQIRSSSKLAAVLILPIVAWVCFATAIVIRLIQING